MSTIKVSVRVAGKGELRKLRLSPSSDILVALKETGHNPETVVVRLNGRIVPETEKLSDGDEIEIIPIVSGG